MSKPRQPKDLYAKRIHLLCIAPNITETYNNLNKLFKIFGFERVKLNLEKNDPFSDDDKANNPLVGKMGPQCKFACFICKKPRPFDFGSPAELHTVGNLKFW